MTANLSESPRPHQGATRPVPTTWRRRVGLSVVGLLGLALTLALASRVFQLLAPELGVVPYVLSFLSIAVLLGPAVYLILRMRDVTHLKISVLLASALIFVSQALDVTAHIAWMDTWPIVGDQDPWHDLVRWATLVFGLFLMMASLYFALIGTVFIKDQLEVERQRALEHESERRRAEKELFAQDQRYRAAISQAGAIPYRINWRTREYAFFDNAIHELTGYSPEELTFEAIQSLPIETKMLGPLADLTEEDALERIRSGTLDRWECEYRIRTKQGEERWLHDSSVEIFDDQGRLVESVGLFQDVTERKTKEEAIARSERYYRALIENGLDLITVIDENGLIRYESPSIERVLGYRQHELIGRNVLEFVHPDDQGRVLRAFTEGLKNPGATPTLKFRCLHNDGTWRTLESIGSNRLGDPVIRGAIINSRDVTERDSLEHQLLQSQKMEGIGRLAGGVAHDFNNLLTCVMGYADVLQAAMGEDDPNAKHVDEIIQATERASELTRQLLAFARKQMVEPRNVNLNTLVLNLDKMLRRLIGEDIELVTIPCSTPAIVCIDPIHFEQVVINLAVNARDAMPNGGKLTVEIDLVELDEEYAKYHSEVQPGPYVLFAMSDTGLGMSEEVRARIFEPFFTTKEAGKGTGLGLATCYGIVKQAGGHVWVYSEPNKGTAFKIYLPLVGEGVSDGTKSAARPRALGGRETILLVEDEPRVRSITYYTLKERGYHVIEAGDGASAIEVARRYPSHIDLLLTDVVLPQLSGRELADQIHATRPGTKVLYMSGYTEDAIVHHRVLENSIAFLPKPFTPETLARKVREVLDSGNGKMIPLGPPTAAGGDLPKEP